MTAAMTWNMTSSNITELYQDHPPDPQTNRTRPTRGAHGTTAGATVAVWRSGPWQLGACRGGLTH